MTSYLMLLWLATIVVMQNVIHIRRVGTPVLQEHDFQYDVFVSYASEDEHWVFQHLMPELEGRLGLRMCLHKRDFIPGKHIVDNIVHCVESSKKVMMLFSADFARSPWCQFELTLCLTHVMENDDALLVVHLYDVASRDMTSAMMAVMKTTTYIEWRRLQEHDFQYYVFVSYASEDQDWVFQHLIAGVGGTAGLEAVSYTSGPSSRARQIVDNIGTVWRAARKVMMLFSADFARITGVSSS
nr:hypothetical protein BaRGS_015216 [Batillaria attramentaria]